VANVTFVFGTSPNTKPEEKKWGDIAYYVRPPEKVDTGDVSPTKLRPWAYTQPILMRREHRNNAPTTIADGRLDARSLNN